jgi:DNA-binding transcriptional MocR family regulator
VLGRFAQLYPAGAALQRPAGGFNLWCHLEDGLRFKDLLLEAGRRQVAFVVSEQGAEINRPSTLYVEVDSEDDEVTAVRVGGQVVLVAKGVVRF